MKKSFKLLICWIALAQGLALFGNEAHAAENTMAPPSGEAHGYFRVGAGENQKGGKIDCYRNSGPEFRLGNECSIYGELKLQKNLINENEKNSPFQIGALWALSREGNTDWEGGEIALRELYTEAQNIEGSGYHFWVGKKYFRWSDVYILDWYPVQFNGVGAGIMKGSDWSFSAIVESGATSSNDIGQPTKTSLHWRKDNIELSSKYKLDTWLAGGVTREHQLTTTKNSVTTTQNYPDTQGLMVAMKLKGDMLGVNTDLGVVLGQGNLVDLGPDGTSVDSSSNSTYRGVLYAQMNFERKDRFSGQAILAYNYKKLGTSVDGFEEWTAVGVQPVYYLTDHLQLTGVVGYSVVKALHQNDKTLFRMTVGPQFAMSRSFWSRPVLRTFVSYNQWNDSNQSSVATNSAARNQNSAWGLGFQTEAWF